MRISEEHLLNRRSRTVCNNQNGNFQKSNRQTTWRARMWYRNQMDKAHSEVACNVNRKIESSRSWYRHQHQSQLLSSGAQIMLIQKNHFLFFLSCLIICLFDFFICSLFLALIFVFADKCRMTKHAGNKPKWDKHSNLDWPERERETARKGEREKKTSWMLAAVRVIEVSFYFGFGSSSISLSLSLKFCECRCMTSRECVCECERAHTHIHTISETYRKRKRNKDN